MADASLALAERRPDDLKKATERLGMEAPTAGQLRSLRFLGLVAPPASAGILMRIRGVLIAIVLVIAVLALGFGIVYGIGSAAGGISVDIAIFYGFLLVLIALGVMAFIGRRRQKRAKAARAEQVASASPIDADAALCAGGTRWRRRTPLRFGRASRSASRSRSGSATTSRPATRCSR